MICKWEDIVGRCVWVHELYVEIQSQSSFYYIDKGCPKKRFISQGQIYYQFHGTMMLSMHTKT